MKNTRSKLIKFISLLFISLFLISACSKKPQVYTKTVVFFQIENQDGSFKTMGSPFGTSIQLVTYDKKFYDKVYQDFEVEIIKLHKLFDHRSFYYEDGIKTTNLKVINESYGSGENVVIDEDLFNIIDEGIKATKLSKGSFNVAIGALSNLWDENIKSNIGKAKENTIDLTPEQVETALLCVPTYEEIDNAVVLDNNSKTITLNALNNCEGRVSLDLGALAKSYAVRKIIENNNYKNKQYFINAGSSTIMLSSKKNKKDYWKVLIPTSSLNKTTPNESLFLLSYHDYFSVTTSSGNLNGYFNKDDVLRHHVIDGRDGYPKNYYHSLTIVCDDAFYGDIASTAMMNLTGEELDEFINDFGKLVNNFGFLLQNDEKIIMNEVFKEHINESFGFEVEMYETKA